MESSNDPLSQTAGDNALVSEGEMKDFFKQMNDWHKKLQDFIDGLPNVSDQRSAVVVLGKTGTGKSTVINGLAGVDLKYFDHPIEQTPVVDCVNIESGEIIEGKTKIGHSGEAETKIPIAIEDPEAQIVYYDCGGFEDTEGAGIEIQNTFYLQTLASTLRKVKIILAVAAHTITQDRKNGILSELDQVTRLFCDLDFLKSSLYLVVTKGPMRTTKESVLNKLRRYTENQPIEKIKDVVNSLITNDRIGFFPSPSEDGLVKREIFEQIKGDLIRVPDGVQMGQLRMEISKPGKAFMDSVFIELQRLITDQLAKISEKVINQACLKKIAVAECINQVYDFTNKLLKARPLKCAGNTNYISLSKEKTLNELKNYANDLIEIGNVEALKEDCEELKKLVWYVEELLKISPEKILDSASWSEKVLDLQKQLVDLTIISDALVGNTLVFKGIVINTGYIQKKVSEQEGQKIKRVEVYCLNKFFGDDNLALPGIDLLIVSPTWFISNPMEINLSGRDQEALPTQEHHFGNDDKKSDKDGKPGLPGGNSGNFICIGNEISHFSRMKLVLNGGRGGRGSQGEEGESGGPGCDGDLDRVKQRAKECLISKELCYSVSSLVCSVVTLNGKFNEVYESKGEIGEKGKDGGKGGCGGRGGRNGQAHIFIGRGQAEITEQIVLEANTGSDGIPGAGGEGGVGGRGGKSYEATYFNEMVLPELRDKRFWTSKSTSRRILSAPRSASRGLIHALILAAHIPVPVLLPVLTALQLCVSSHAAIANSRWKEPPEESFYFEESGEPGKTPEEKNYFGVTDPQPNDFNGNLERERLNEKYLEYCSQTEMFHSLIKSIQ